METLLILLSSSDAEIFARIYFIVLLLILIFGGTPFLIRRIKYTNKKNWQEMNTEIYKKINSDIVKDKPKLSTLREELKAKCIPSNFTYPYDYYKVKIANELYIQILSCSPDDETKLKELKEKAANELNITFCK